MTSNNLNNFVARVPILNGSANYADWSMEIKNLLKIQGVFSHIGEDNQTVPPQPQASGSPPATSSEVRNWSQDQEKAWGLLAMTIDKETLRATLEGANPAIATPQALWEKLKSLYEKKGAISVYTSFRELVYTKFSESETMESQFSHLSALKAQLEVSGLRIDKNMWCMIIIHALPSSYKTFIESFLGTTDASSLNIDTIRSRVIELEASKQQESGSSAMAMTKGKGIYCNYCKGIHPGGERNCFKKQKNSQNKGGKAKYTSYNKGKGKDRDRGPRRLNVATLNDESQSKVLLYNSVSNFASNELSRTSWMLDSGSTDHISNERSDLSNYVEYRPPKLLTVGNGDTIKVLGQGNAHLMIKIYGQLRHIEIANVQYIPDSNFRLLSESLLCEGGYSIKRAGNQTEITKNGKIEAIGMLRGGQYWLDTFDHLSMNAMSSVKRPISPRILHRRMGHLHEAAVLKTPDQVEGVSLSSTERIGGCEACIFGKQARTMFPSNPSRERKPQVLDLVHSDLMESNVSSIGGNVYICTFIDDQSHMVFAYLLKKKDQTFNSFKDFLALVETQTGKKLKVLRSDNGGEYKSKEFKAFIASKGIEQQFTTPYTPQQNSVAERMNRTIMEKARAIRFDSGLAPKFWGEAVKHAVYLINRTPSRVLNFKTPFELWNGYKPNLSNLRIFGCAAYAKTPEEKLKKQDYRSKKMIFLGFEPGQKAFRLYDPDKRQISVSRDVIFDEDHFPARPKTVTMELDLSLSHQDHALPVKAKKRTAKTSPTPILTQSGSSNTPAQGSLLSPSSRPILDAINEEEDSEDAQAVSEDLLQPLSNEESSESPKEKQSNIQSPLSPEGIYREGSSSLKTPSPAPLKVIGLATAKKAREARKEYPSELSIHKDQTLEIIANTGDWWVVRGPEGDQKVVPAKYMRDFISLTDPKPKDKGKQREIPLKPTPTEVGVDYLERVAPVGALPLKRERRPSKKKADPNNIAEQMDRESRSKRTNVASLKEPTTFKQAMESEDADKWLAAIEEELNSLKKMETWHSKPVIPPNDRKAVKNKWVFKIKVAPDGTPIRYKARLVAKGFSQVEGIDYEETFSPVARYESFRILMALAAKSNWEIHQMDVKTAFLNGDLNEEIYMEHPEGFKTQKGIEGTALKLNKAIYGLKQASRQWNKKIDDTLRHLQFKRLQSDHGVYIKRTSKNLTIIILYVDDLTIIGDDLQTINSVKGELSKKFEMTDLGEISSYLGMRISRDRNKKIIQLDQEQYLKDVLARFQMQEVKPARTPLPVGAKLTKSSTPPEKCDKEFRTLYQSIIGSIMYAAIGCRPDLAYAATRLSSFSSNPDQSHLSAAKHTLRYIKGTLGAKLTYKGNHSRDCIGYSDSCWGGNLEDRKSTTGHCFFLSGGAVTWTSKKQPTVALSSVEAEYMAITSAAKHAKWMQKLFDELGLQYSGAISFRSDKNSLLPLRSDSQGAIAMANNPVHHQRTKHIDIQHHFIRECIENGNIEVAYTPTEDMIADVFTKGLTFELHSKHSNALGLIIPNTP